LVLRGLVEHGLGLFDRTHLVKRDLVIVAIQRQTQRHARLSQGGTRLLQPQFIIPRLDLGQQIPRPHHAPDVHHQLLQTPGHFRAERRLLVSRQRARRLDAPLHQTHLDSRQPHRARGFSPVLSRLRTRRRLAARTEQQASQNKSRNPAQHGATHGAHSILKHQPLATENRRTVGCVRPAGVDAPRKTGASADSSRVAGRLQTSTWSLVRQPMPCYVAHD